MELVRTVITIVFCVLHLSRTVSDDNLCGVYITPPTQNCYRIGTAGQVAFYQNFITCNLETSKRRSQIYDYRTSSKNVLSVCILLCGDVHPCPGPPGSVNSESFQHFRKRGLHFIHLNIRSILPKIDELREIAIKTRAAVFGITETWLDESVFDSEIIIPGYSIVRRDRNREGGGVCLFIRNNLTFNNRIDLYIDDLEALWIEILLPHTKPIL